MSLKRIAEACGVSVSTVSRVLRSRDVKCASEETRGRIWTAAQAIGYTPSLEARALQRGGREAQALSIALVQGRVTRQESNAFFQTLLESCCTQLLALGYPVAKPLFVDDVLQNPQGTRGVDGIILMGRCDAKKQRALAGLATLVCVGLNSFETRYDQVLCSGYQATRTAMAWLADKGHHHIGYAGEQYNENRYIAYRDAMRALARGRETVYKTMQSVEGGERVARLYAADGERPTALMCANDSIALGFLKKMQGAAVPLPDIISIDDVPEAQRSTPKLTTIHIPAEEMGAMAVKVLADRKRGGHSEPVTVQFPFRLVRRESS